MDNSDIITDSKFSKIIITPPCSSFGDTLSIISVLYFLRKYYDNIYLCIENNTVLQYYILFLDKDPLFNIHLFLCDLNGAINILNGEPIGSVHICNIYTGTWEDNEVNFKLYNHSNVNKKYYFSYRNPLYNVHKISDEYITNPNSKIPFVNTEINHIAYYKLIGLNNNVRMNYFIYYRNLSKEEVIKKMILERYNIKEGEKYNIMNSFDESTNSAVLQKIHNIYKTINIHHLVDCTGYLLSLIESAEELHLVEGLNTNFIYHCQYKNIINISKKKIYFHIWARNRKWEQYNMDYSWKMLDNPKLDNWNYLF